MSIILPILKLLLKFSFIDSHNIIIIITISAIAAIAIILLFIFIRVMCKGRSRQSVDIEMMPYEHDRFSNLSEETSDIVFNAPVVRGTINRCINKPVDKSDKLKSICVFWNTYLMTVFTYPKCHTIEFIKEHCCILYHFRFWSDHSHQLHNNCPHIHRQTHWTSIYHLRFNCSKSIRY